MKEALPAPPYPPDTRAKGWRFELDYERIEQSDTWALAAEVPMAQHALLMMWLVAWKETPCGSLPADEAVIRSKLRVPPKTWAAMRDVLMRGWVKADDNRLYHATVGARVQEMLDYRAKQAKRVADFKLRKREQQGANALPTGDKRDSNDTGTGTGTGTISPTEIETAHAVSARGAVGMALKAGGISPMAINLDDPRIDALIAAGATAAHFEGLAREAVKSAKSNPIAWVLAVLPERIKAGAGIKANKHTGFSTKDYRAGVTDDGTIAAV